MKERAGIHKIYLGEKGSSDLPMISIVYEDKLNLLFTRRVEETLLHYFAVLNLGYKECFLKC